jgi:hypothetical protein
MLEITSKEFFYARREDGRPVTWSRTGGPKEGEPTNVTTVFLSRGDGERFAAMLEEKVTIEPFDEVNVMIAIWPTHSQRMKES